MPLVDYVDPDDATGRAEELLAADADRYGQPSLFARVLANAPDVLAARSDYHDRLLEGGDLDRRTAELVYLAVSVTADCEYCVASHREVLVEQVGLSSSAADALARGSLEAFDERERAVIRFAEQVASDPEAVADEDLRRLSKAGYDDAAVVRLLTVAAAAVAANTIADALGVAPADRETDFAE